MKIKTPTLARLTIAVAASLALAACGGGGGGGGTKSDPPPPPPVTPTPPTTCQDNAATNFGGALPCAYRYNGPADNLLVPSNIDQVHAAGITGSGVKVGLLDDAKFDYAPLTGAVASYVNYTGQDAASKVKPWHGVEMAAIIAGRAGTNFKGGVAPGASLYWARVCDDKGCGSNYSKAAVSDLVDVGVRIFNVSNSVRDTNDQIGLNTADMWREVYDKALQAGSLIVASTGNDSASSAGVPAAIPKYFGEWASQFIAATGVDVDSKGVPTGLGRITMDNGQAGTLNACGDAAQWCVAAPVPVSLPAGGSITSGYISGTSVAAAEVTGVAALVSQKFPWMSGSNLQTTILTTATDIGEAGVDRQYGWGLINAAKAVNGPSQFVTDFRAVVDTVDGGVFANAISGTGGLIKTGSGSLTLAAHNSYSGLTSVEGGTLVLTGTVAGDVNVSKATLASLGGRIGGSYHASADAVTAVQVGTGLTVTGAAALDGTLKLLAPSSTYSVGSRETVLNAGTVTGTFSQTSYGNEFFWSATLDYSPNSVVANLTRNSAAASATALSMTPAVVEGAKHADVLVAQLDKDASSGKSLGNVSTSVASVMSSALPEAAVALESLNGQVYGTAQALAFAQADADATVLTDRLAGLGAERPGVWVQAYGLDGTQDKRGFNSANMHLFGGMAGTDAILGQGVTIGAAIASSRLRGDIDALNGSTKGHANTLALYARAGTGKPYITGFLGYSDLSQDVSRTVVYGGNAERLSTTIDGTVWQARIEAGYSADAGITPFAALSHTRLSREGFDEGSRSGLGLTGEKTTHRTTTGEIGLRWRTAWSRGHVGAGAAFRHRFGDRSPSFLAAFDGLSDATFSVEGTPLSTNDGRVSLNGTYELTPSAYLFGDVSALWDNARGRNVTGTAGLRIGF